MFSQVTFPASLGNVETLAVDDKHVIGVNAAVNVYSMVNISITADNNDATGKCTTLFYFRIMSSF